MPDTFRYTSVSVSKKAHHDLTEVQNKLNAEYGVQLSIAKVIEKLASQEVTKNVNFE